MSKLIVIDGIDGSGKSTQTTLLHKELYQQGRNVRIASFPNYQSKTGELINMYLRGDFGAHPDSVNPYAASSFYSLDRYLAFLQTWDQFYKEPDSILLASRYTTSNAIHQLSKLPRDEWDGFLSWLEDYEYNLLGLPKPDVVYFLDLKPEYAEELVSQRSETTGQMIDIHEQDDEYISRCYKAGTYASEKLGWKRIPCNDEKGILTIEDIHTQLLEEVTMFLDIKGE